MKDKNICKRIQHLCFQKGIDYKGLYDLLCDVIYSENADIGLPDISTVSRWCNNQVKNPDSKWLPYIAKALEITEEELLLGEESPTVKLQKEVERLSTLYSMDEKEKQIISRLLWLSNYHTFVFSSFSIALGLFFLNATVWKNNLIYSLCFIYMITLYRYDGKKYKKEMKISKKHNSKEETRVFFKGLFKNEYLSRVLMHYFTLTVLFAFIPLAEILFYKGTYYLSSVIFFALGIIVVIQSLLKK